MSESTPTELLTAAVRCFAPYRGINAQNTNLKILDRKLTLIPCAINGEKGTFVMRISRCMLQVGLTSKQWDYLQLKLISLTKEIDP